jgi:hypothetical protein
VPVEEPGPVRQFREPVFAGLLATSGGALRAGSCAAQPRLSAGRLESILLALESGFDFGIARFLGADKCMEWNFGNEAGSSYEAQILPEVTRTGE